MKKFRIIFASIAIILLIVILKSNNKWFSNVQSFDYTVYKPFIDICSVDDINIGPVDSLDTALEKADIIWKGYFSNEIYEEIQKNERPYQVYYNPEKDLWLICGHSTPYWIGGVAYVVIQSDGKVLAVWHTK